MSAPRTIVDPAVREAEAAFERMMELVNRMSPEEHLAFGVKHGFRNPDGSARVHEEELGRGKSSSRKESLVELIEDAWGLIANANWEHASAEWRHAAMAWHDQMIAVRRAEKGST